MVWNEPALFIAGLFLITLAGVLLPIRLEGREDHIVLTMAAGVATALLGPRGLFLVWVAIAFAAPCILGLSFLPRRRAFGVAGATRSIAWTVVSAVAISFGFLCANFVYTGLFHREWPISLASTKDVWLAALVGFVAYVGTMSIRLLSQRAISPSFIAGGLDQLASPLIPYLLPIMSGFPLITAAIAMYRPEDPWPVLMIMWWVFPIYAATAFEIRRRTMAQELRRDVIAKQRLAAIGEVSARIVHQSRHQVGLMGWSIHRLRGLVGRTSPLEIAATEAELDALAEAKDRLSEMLASELLHERATDEPVVPAEVDTDDDDRPTVASLLTDVAEQLQDEADREGVTLSVDVGGANGTRVAGKQLRDVVFNLVDNAIDAAATSVVVRLVEHAANGNGEAAPMTISVTDDGPGLPDDAERIFEPFFTTKSDGTGMGLAIADALVGDLGGDLAHERVEDTTTFVVTLP